MAISRPQDSDLWNAVTTRRKFLRGCVIFGLSIVLPTLTGAPARAAPTGRRHKKTTPPTFKKAKYWEPLDNGRVRCTTCPNFCEREEGDITLCNTRINRGGTLYTMTYARPCVIFTDPLEKNPLYHVAPGSNAIATATAGCNFHCLYCQNWEISQVGPDQTRNMDLSPEALVKKVTERGLKWLTFAYTEPVAYYEYALDTAKIAKERGIKVAVVTAGYINPKPLETLLRYTDAFSITLKGYTEKFYREVCGGSLSQVWDTIVTIAQSKRWLELATLIVPGMNDEEEGFRAIARSVAKLNRDIPLHFQRFSPLYKLKHLPPTPRSTLEKARGIALAEGLRYVYLSNLWGHKAGNTYCPKCKKILIERIGFKILNNRIRQNKCPYCSKSIPGLNLS